MVEIMDLHGLKDHFSVTKQKGVRVLIAIIPNLHVVYPRAAQ